MSSVYEEWDRSKSETACCVYGCNMLGRRTFDGKLFCLPHWEEEQAGAEKAAYKAAVSGEDCTDCNGCPLPCDVDGCKGEGVITQNKTGKHFCLQHAWKADRPDENGLSHPTTAQWEVTDALRAHGAGVIIDISKLPIVPDDISEQCRKEIAEGQKRGWKK